MTVTTNHPASSYGLPVILADDGSVIDYAEGVKSIRAKLELSAQDLADACGVSRRTVEGWEQGRAIGAAPLNVMGMLLASGCKLGVKSPVSPSGETAQITETQQSRDGGIGRRT